METTVASPSVRVEKESYVVGLDCQGGEFRGTLLRYSRYLAVFEIYAPAVVLQTSEVLTGFKIILDDRPAYSGNAVVANLVHAGAVLVCEATLQDSWVEREVFSLASRPEELRSGFAGFMRQWELLYKIHADYKVAVADLQSFLMDLRLWLEQVELGIRSLPAADRWTTELRVVEELTHATVPALAFFFEKFEVSCRQVPAELQPVHRNYVKRQLHPIVLCAPFMYRTFQKPLGYAGDYEMVNMMVRDPREGASVFAKVLNTFFLSTPPVVAHRNRIVYLKAILVQEAARVARAGRRTKIFNLGCGPAREIQEFIAESDLSSQTQFTLLDFSEETLDYTQRVLTDLARTHHRDTKVQLLKKSVVLFIREAKKPNSALVTPVYDLVYCAGLFDYLTDQVCAQLMAILYRMLAPGGLLIATNVDECNPARNWMEFSVDWHLIYRNPAKMMRIAPRDVSPDNCRLISEDSGVNVFLEVRKPADA